jgi:hypothetical protein
MSMSCDRSKQERKGTDDFSWSISYVHRPPLAKVDYEKEIKRVATFGSVCCRYLKGHGVALMKRLNPSCTCILT